MEKNLSSAVSACASVLTLLGSAPAQSKKPPSPAKPVHASIVILLRKPMPFDGAKIAEAAGRSAGITVLYSDPKKEKGKPEKTKGQRLPHFLAGDAKLALLRMKGRSYTITHGTEPVWEKKETVAESINLLRVRQAIQEHTGSLHIRSISKTPNEKVQMRDLAILGRLAASLLTKNALAISFSTDQRLYVIDSNARDKLRSKDPAHAFRTGKADPPVIVTEDEDREMNAAMEKARATWSQFVDHFGDHGKGSVKYPVTEGEHTEHLWVTVVKLEKGRIYGTVGNSPVNLKKVKLGSPVNFPTTKISDWIYMHDQKLHGGFTAKLLMKRHQAAQGEAKKKGNSK